MQGVIQQCVNMTKGIVLNESLMIIRNDDKE